MLNFIFWFIGIAVFAGFLGPAGISKGSTLPAIWFLVWIVIMSIFGAKSGRFSYWAVAIVLAFFFICLVFNPSGIVHQMFTMRIE
jgi:hypothetical protein